MNKLAVFALAGLTLCSFCATTAQATAVTQGTATVHWETLAITGPISIVSGQYTATFVESQLVNTNGASSDTDTSQDWTSSISAAGAIGNDNSSASADTKDLMSTDNVSAPTATAASPFELAGSYTSASRYGEYILTADGAVTIEIDYSLVASGATEYAGEISGINVVATLQLYVFGTGPPIDIDVASINTDLLDGSSGNFLTSGTLAVTFSATQGTTGFFAVEAVANDFAQTSFVPEPTSLALTVLGVVGIGYRRRRRSCGM